MKERIAVTVGAVIVILLALAQPKLDGNQLAKETCLAGCPFSCQSGDGANGVTEEEVQRFLGVIRQMPTFSLWWYRDYIDHWTVLREECWAPQLLESGLGKEQSALDSRKWACVLATRALSMRSLPPPHYSQSWDEIESELRLVQDKGVIEFVYALKETEAIQVSSGQALLSPEEREELLSRGSPPRIGATGGDPYFYSTVVRASKLSASAKSMVQRPPLVQDQVDALLASLEAAQTELDVAIRAMGPRTEARADGEGGPRFMISKDNLSDIAFITVKDEPPGLCVYAIYLNAWADIECGRICLGSPSEAGSSVIEGIDELVRHFEGTNAANGDSSWPGGGRLAGHAPEQLIVSLMITAMELSFVIGEEEDKLEFSQRNSSWKNYMILEFH